MLLHAVPFRVERAIISLSSDPSSLRFFPSTKSKQKVRFRSSSSSFENVARVGERDTGGGREGAFSVKFNEARLSLEDRDRRQRYGDTTLGN